MSLKINFMTVFKANTENLYISKMYMWTKVKIDRAEKKEFDE